MSMENVAPDKFTERSKISSAYTRDEAIEELVAAVREAVYGCADCSDLDDSDGECLALDLSRPLAIWDMYKDVR